MLSIASPLLALPAVTTSYGADGWAAVAIGQSIGGGAAVLVELGWALSGSQRVAPLMSRPARRILALSLVTKAIVLAPILTSAFVLGMFLAQNQNLAAALTAVGTALTGLSCVWFYMGRAQLKRILLLDSVPRLAGILFAALWINHGGPLWAYAVIGIILPCCASLILITTVEGLTPSLLRGYSMRRYMVVLNIQRHALAARSLSALYISLPVAVVSIVAPNAVAVFGAIERLQRMTLQVLAVLPNMMQSWIGSATDFEERRQRIDRAILYNGGLGVAAGITYACLAPLAADLVFSGVVDVSLELSILSGTLVLIVCLSRGTGNLALVAMRKIRTITRSTLWGSTVGVLALFILAKLFGTLGALIAEIIAELVVLLVQTLGIRRGRTSSRANKYSKQLEAQEI